LRWRIQALAHPTAGASRALHIPGAAHPGPWRLWRRRGCAEQLPL